MSISESFLAELDREAQVTRAMLARVPQDQFDWKPHAKSMSLGRLATHIAEIPSWIRNAVDLDELDIQPPGAPPFAPQTAASLAELLDMFDTNVADARKAIGETADAHWGKSWTLKAAGNDIFSLPRAGVMRSMVLSHLIHHRGQLSVYLRLNDVPLPRTYGPSADEM
jgi:uncharacterized damage-inducible protein DinB